MSRPVRSFAQPAPRTLAARRNEAPLERLRKRGAKGGDAYITHTEYNAGVRFARDVELAQGPPRVTVDWERPPSGSKIRGPRDPACFTDGALAARVRLDRVLAALGPDLSSIALWACAQERGLEDAEKAFSLPPRSAKAFLRVALRKLASHYGLVAPVAPARRRAWISGDGRPVMFADGG